MIPANAPDSSASWLFSQLPPCASTTSATAATRPARSAPTTVSTSVVMGLSVPIRVSRSRGCPGTRRTMCSEALAREPERHRPVGIQNCDRFDSQRCAPAPRLRPCTAPSAFCRFHLGSRAGRGRRDHRVGDRAEPRRCGCRARAVGIDCGEFHADSGAHPADRFAAAPRNDRRSERVRGELRRRRRRRRTDAADAGRAVHGAADPAARRPRLRRLVRHTGGCRHRSRSRAGSTDPSWSPARTSRSPCTARGRRPTRTSPRTPRSRS